MVSTTDALDLSAAGHRDAPPPPSPSVRNKAPRPKRPAPVRVTEREGYSSAVEDGAARRMRGADIFMTSSPVPRRRRRTSLTGATNELDQLEDGSLSASARRQSLAAPSRPSEISRKERKKLSAGLSTPFWTLIDPTQPADDREPKFVGESLLAHAVPLVLDKQPATLGVLVHRLTHEKYSDMELVETFLLTYSTFMGDVDLADALLAALCKASVRAARLRVVNVFKHWFDKYPGDFERNPALCETVDAFCAEHAGTAELGPMVALLDRYRRRDGQERRSMRLRSLSQDLPPAPLPKGSKPPRFEKSTRLEFADIDARAFAEQLTLAESHLYLALDGREFLDKRWNSCQKHRLAPNITATIAHFNLVSQWVATEIVTTRKLKERVKVLKKFIKIAGYLRELNNFNGVIEVLSGLTCTSVFRLKDTWKGISSKKRKLFEELRQMLSTDGSFSKYRQLLREVNPPCIPYLGVFLSDATHIADGNPDTYEGGLINFQKRVLLARCVRSVEIFQTPFPIRPVIPIRRFIDTIQCLGEDQLFVHSVTAEPHGRSRSATMPCLPSFAGSSAPSSAVPSAPLSATSSFRSSLGDFGPLETSIDSSESGASSPASIRRSVSFSHALRAAY